MAEQPLPSTKPVLDPIIEGVPLEDRLDGEFDFVHVFVTHRDQIQREGSGWRVALKPNGILWIAYPKGKAIATDLNRDSLYQAALAAGLQGVSQVAIDDVWSALRFKRM